MVEHRFYLHRENICHGVPLFCSIVWEAFPFFCILDIFSTLLKKSRKSKQTKKKASQPWPPSPTNTLKGFNENNFWQLCLSDQCGMESDTGARTKCKNIFRTQYYSWNKRFRCLFLLTHCVVRSQTELKMQLEEWKCPGWCKLVLTPSVFQNKQH